MMLSHHGRMQVPAVSKHIIIISAAFEVGLSLDQGQGVYRGWADVDGSSQLRLCHTCIIDVMVIKLLKMFYLVSVLQHIQFWMDSFYIFGTNYH